MAEIQTPQNTKKRSHSDVSDTSTNELEMSSKPKKYQEGKNPPSFLVMESLNEMAITRLSPFKISKIFDKIKPKNVKKLNNGTLLIETKNKTQTEEILKWKYLDNLSIKTYPHRTLNYSKGVVKSSELALCSIEEIQENVENVIEVQRIRITKNEETINTNTYILTFDTPKVPKEIKMGYEKLNVEPYIPNPLRCHNCQKFGHHKNKCTRSPVCERCGAKDTHIDCREEPRCANCGENHWATSKGCNIWKKEKEINKIKYMNNITFPEARKQIENKYSEVAKRNIPGVSKAAGCHACETNTTNNKTEIIKLFNEMKELLKEFKKAMAETIKPKDNTLDTSRTIQMETQQNKETKLENNNNQINKSEEGKKKTEGKNPTESRPNSQSRRENSHHRSRSRTQKSQTNSQTKTTPTKKEKEKIKSNQRTQSNPGKKNNQPETIGNMEVEESIPPDRRNTQQ